MPTYRIYIVGRDGSFLGAAEVVECVDDNEAIGRLRRSRVVSVQRFGTRSALSRSSRPAIRFTSLP